MATTEATLTALAEAEDAGWVDLRLDPGLYPPTSLAAATAAFDGLCRVRRLSGGELRVRVVDPASGGHRRLLGEFLNFVLIHAVGEQSGSEASA